MNSRPRNKPAMQCAKLGEDGEMGDGPICGWRVALRAVPVGIWINQESIEVLYLVIAGQKSSGTSAPGPVSPNSFFSPRAVWLFPLCGRKGRKQHRDMSSPSGRGGLANGNWSLVAGCVGVRVARRLETRIGVPNFQPRFRASRPCRVHSCSVMKPNFRAGELDVEPP